MEFPHLFLLQAWSVHLPAKLKGGLRRCIVMVVTKQIAMLSEAPGMRSFLISGWDVTLWQIQLVSRYFIRYGSVGQDLIFNALKFPCLNAPQGWSEHAPNMRPFLGWAWSQISKNLGIFRWTLCPAAELRRSIFVLVWPRWIYHYFSQHSSNTACLQDTRYDLTFILFASIWMIGMP